MGGNGGLWKSLVDTLTPVMRLMSDSNGSTLKVGEGGGLQVLTPTKNTRATEVKERIQSSSLLFSRQVELPSWASKLVTDLGNHDVITRSTWKLGDLIISSCYTPLYFSTVSCLQTQSISLSIPHPNPKCPNPSPSSANAAPTS
jgi:hypothetical protein